MTAKAKQFDDVAVESAVRSLADLVYDTPELRGVAVVFLWDRPNQESFKQAVVVKGDDDPPLSPDELVRLTRATTHLQQFLAASIADAVDRFRDEAVRLAGHIHELRTTQEASDQGQPDQAPHGHRQEDRPA